MRLVPITLLLVLGLGLGLAVAGCRRDPQPMKPEPGELPPLPPASGTAVGYLVDAAGDLALRDDQLDQLKELDGSLAVRNGELDVQIRQIERPVPQEQLSAQQQKAGEQQPRYNNAPGASTIMTDESRRLRKLRDENEREALTRAFAVLDEDQTVKARSILEARGVVLPPRS
jgi:hypothetical protein